MNFKSIFGEVFTFLHFLLFVFGGGGWIFIFSIWGGMDFSHFVLGGCRFFSFFGKYSPPPYIHLKMNTPLARVQ